MQVPRTDVTVLAQRLPLRLAKRSPRRRELGRCCNSSPSSSEIEVVRRLRNPWRFERLAGADDDADALVPCRGLGVAIGLPRACTVRSKRKRGPLARSVGRPQREQRARGLRWLLLPIGSRLPVTLSRARPDLRTPPVTVVSARDETVRCWLSTMRNPPNIDRRFWVVASRASARRGGGRPPQRGGSRRRGSGSRRSPGRRSACDSWPAV